MVRLRVTSSGLRTASDVWGIVTDLVNEPQYWRGTKKVLSVERHGDYVTRDVVLAFRNSRAKERITLHDNRRLVVEFVDGPMRGTRVTEVEEDGTWTRLTTTWDVRLRGGLAFLSPLIARHIRKGTEAAHRRILSQ